MRRMGQHGRGVLPYLKGRGELLRAQLSEAMHLDFDTSALLVTFVLLGKLGAFHGRSVSVSCGESWEKYVLLPTHLFSAGVHTFGATPLNHVFGRSSYLGRTVGRQTAGSLTFGPIYGSETVLCCPLSFEQVLLLLSRLQVKFWRTHSGSERNMSSPLQEKA